MLRKPTYEELAQRNKELEKEVVNCRRTEQALRESEKRLKNITNSIEELFVLLDKNFNIQLINTTLARAWNISLDECKGKLCYELFYGRNDICEGCPAIQVLNEGKVTRGSLRYRPDGLIYDRTAYPLMDDNGNITGVIVVGCDITEQKQAEEKLRESEEKYRLLVENQTDMIVTFDTEGRLIFVSPSYLETFGKTEDELIGKNFMPFIHKEDREAVAKAIASVHKPPYTGYVEERVMTKDGWRWQAWINTAILNDHGNVESIVAVGRDINEQKQIEESLRESEEKYRSMMEAMVEPAYICTSDFIVSYMNPAMVERTGRDATGELCHKVINDLDEQCPWCVHDKIQNGERDETIILSPKDHRLYSITSAPIFHNDSYISKMNIYRDITDIKQTEQRLKQREKELEEKNVRLEEMNAALKILLDKRDKDKKELEDKVLTNIKELVFPYILKLKNTGLSDRQAVYADIIQSHIEEIVSPFALKLSHKYLNFTPTEIKVAFFVKQGLRTKEIAKMLGSSPETITRHRKSMRKKLQLTDKKANLRTHLLSLADGDIK